MRGLYAAPSDRVVICPLLVRLTPAQTIISRPVHTTLASMRPTMGARANARHDTPAASVLGGTTPAITATVSTHATPTANLRNLVCMTPNDSLDPRPHLQCRAPPVRADR